jgi:hypothetical protein
MNNFETHPADNPKMHQLVSGIFEEVDSNIDLYDETSGVTVNVGNAKWQIQAEGYKVTMSRACADTYCHETYEINPGYFIIKKELDPDSLVSGLPSEHFLEDEFEASTLRAIVMAAHRIEKFH